MIAVSNRPEPRDGQSRRPEDVPPGKPRTQAAASGTRRAVTTELVPADDNVLREWALLEDRVVRESGPVPATSSLAWTVAWLDAFGETVSARVAVRRRGDEVIGLWLVCDSRHRPAGPIPLRTRHVGTAGEPERGGVFVEWNRPLTSESEFDFFDDLFPLLHHGAADRLHFDGIPEPLAERLPGSARVEWRDCPAMNLEAVRRAAREDAAGSNAGRSKSTDPERGDLTDRPTAEVLAHLKSRFRTKVRSTRRKYGPLRTDWLSGEEAVRRGLPTLIELHEARWPGGGAFRPAFRRFTEALLRGGAAELPVVSDPNGPVGAVLFLREGRRLLSFVLGFADTTERPNPGTVSLVEILQYACDHGWDEVDWLAGENQYKRSLSNTSARLAWAKLDRPTWRMRSLSAARGVRDRVRNWTRPEAPHPDADVPTNAGGDA